MRCLLDEEDSNRVFANDMTSLEKKNEGLSAEFMFASIRSTLSHHSGKLNEFFWYCISFTPGEN